MYDDWSSLSIQLGPSGTTSVSVLSKLPPDEARRVVSSVVKTVASQLGLTSPKDAKPSTLSRETEVIWFMEVICYGLTLPLSEHETIKDCVNVYCEWLSTLLPEPKTCVPAPILEEPNKFSRRVLQHLYHIFVPRKDDSAQDSIHRQAVLCHRVLRRVQDVAKQSQILERETWESLLGFLLASNDALLSPPTVKDDVGDQLCERVLGVLYEIWLVSCVKCFPSPSLWKTFREMCLNWRHRAGLVDQWSKVTLALTARMLMFMSGPNFPQMTVDPDNSLIPPEMSYDCIAQTWFRFLHSLGNPVELSRPSVISQTQAFYQYAIVAENVIDPSHHPCLSALPQIFFKAMKGLAAIVDAFLGMPKPAQTMSTTRSLTEISESYDLLQNRLPHPDRPKCNSILHLIGSWLFEAAFISSEYSKHSADQVAPVVNDHLGTKNSIPAPSLSPKPSYSSQNHTILKKTSTSSVHSSSLTHSDNIEHAAAIPVNQFESGRAEALGALCRIFCSKKTGEEISPMYLARFYLALQQGLSVGPDRIVSESMAMILLNSADLLRVDLKGVNVILPDLVVALEAVLGDQELKMPTTVVVAKSDLRRNSISLLISMIFLPVHFEGLTIKKVLPSADLSTFKRLWPRITNLIFNALQVETDPKNAQLLLGGMMQIVQEFEGQKVQQSLSSHLTDTSSLDGQVPKVTVNDGSSRNDDSTPDDVFLSDEETNSSSYITFVRATHLVCHRLISSWKSDLSTSLAALELLKGLAKANIQHKGARLECKRTVKWLCDYIVAQCSRPPPAHSKDLHSSIVAAFQCCKIWLTRHPYLLHDKESLATVLEVVELGISGSKSQARASDPPTFKEDKSPLPASRRVREAAEGLLNLVLEEVDFFPSSCGAESVSTLMDESSLMRLSSNTEAFETMSMVEASQHFRYFVIDRSILFGILEDSFFSEDEPPPTVTILIRGVTGRSCWTLQLRHLPRHKSGLKPLSINPGRPLPMEDVVPRQNIRPSFFPDSIDRIPLCKADQSIPAVESVASDERSSLELDYLSRLMEEHTAIEGSLVLNHKDNAGYSLETECRAPEPCHEFQTARLILSHLGLLNTKALQESLESPVPQLVALESSSIDFVNDLESLDRLSPRSADTAHVFYMKSGQKTADEILSNVLSADSVHPHFLEFLSTLGWPINVWRHPGWTGHISTSWKVQSEMMKPPDQPNHGGAIFNGDHFALYWADATSEIVFLVPSPGPNSKRRSQDQAPSQDENDQSSDYQKSARKLGRQVSVSPAPDIRTFVVWLENFDDHLNFPVASILAEMDPSDPQQHAKDPCSVIFVHPLSNGLIRVKLLAHREKTTMLATPLVDGMVVSRRSLGSLVLQTALNVATRRRLDLESFQPPHVKRKLKIQEIVTKYRSPMPGPEFYAHLFTRRFAV